MEKLKYVIEDSTIAKILGEDNFSTKNSAVLELVKNAYDAGASLLKISFDKDEIILIDDGKGMSENDIRDKWMRVGYSEKGYKDNGERVLAGSKGIGRFALAKLGDKASMISHRADYEPIIWQTDWNTTTIDYHKKNVPLGTKISIIGLRERWTENGILDLKQFLSKTYNDDIMKIFIYDKLRQNELEVNKYFMKPKVGLTCVSLIKLQFDAVSGYLKVDVTSDEFQNEASKYFPHERKIDEKFEQSITLLKKEINIFEEIKNKVFDTNQDEIKGLLKAIGSFNGELYFSTASNNASEQERFLYKYLKLADRFKEGVVLYRNSFSISSYEGSKDWLEFGKRSRRSPAMATHPSGSWRVRENQMSGKIIIDKKENKFLNDLSNRQGLEEDVYYGLFVLIIQTGIKEFETYRQNIIRSINKKNIIEETEIKETKNIIKNIINNPSSVKELDLKQLDLFADKIKSYEEQDKKHKEEIEHNRYDVRILNVLATIGLRASSVAHELDNDRESMANISTNIEKALVKLGCWGMLSSGEKPKRTYYNVPEMLAKNKKINSKIVQFIDTILDMQEKKKFAKKDININEILLSIRDDWCDKYADIKIELDVEKVNISSSEDIFKVIFDNLILNSIQQNEHSPIMINIKIYKEDNKLVCFYSDNGVGLQGKFKNEPNKILEVHETTRKKGHGLGMWILNNTLIYTLGEVKKIYNQNGFCMEFTIGDLI